MGASKKASIMVVDDELEIRQLIVDYLRDAEHYTVEEAKGGPEALEILAKRQFDLILSDINMPVMKGFELLKIVKEKYPSVKRMLITAYNVEDYLDMALKYDIGNIFVKTVPFNFPELSSLIRNLLTNNIFGFDGYFDETTPRTRFTIRSPRHIDNHARVMAGLVEDNARSKRLEVVIVELLTNAIFYGVRNDSPLRKDLWDVQCELPPEKAIVATVACDREKYGISVCDEGGRLKKTDVLYWLNRQTAQDDKGLPLGLLDLHGRGFFIARRFIDRLIINVHQGIRTEVILINYYTKTFYGHKPLYINEI
jgi:CheY-like chemotaxis protein/anti-sigma regulatory factor (Ser/Thr protein kinase)